MKIQNPYRNFKKNKSIPKNNVDYEINTNFLNKELLDRNLRNNKDIVKYYNNSTISERHGQENIEISLILLSIQIFFTALLVYIYLHNIFRISFGKIEYFLI